MRHTFSFLVWACSCNACWLCSWNMAMETFFFIFQSRRNEEHGQMNIKLWSGCFYSDGMQCIIMLLYGVLVALGKAKPKRHFGTQIEYIANSIMHYLVLLQQTGHSLLMNFNNIHSSVDVCYLNMNIFENAINGIISETRRET